MADGGPVLSPHKLLTLLHPLAGSLDLAAALHSTYIMLCLQPAFHSGLFQYCFVQILSR